MIEVICVLVFILKHFIKNKFWELSIKNNLYLAPLDISFLNEKQLCTCQVCLWVLLLRKEVVFATGSVSSGSRCTPVIGDGKGMFCY